MLFCSSVEYAIIEKKVFKKLIVRHAVYKWHKHWLAVAVKELTYRYVSSKLCISEGLLSSIS